MLQNSSNLSVNELFLQLQDNINIEISKNHIIPEETIETLENYKLILYEDNEIRFLNELVNKILVHNSDVIARHTDNKEEILTYYNNLKSIYERDGFYGENNRNNIEEKKIYNITNDNLCIICKYKRAVISLMPCGHLCLCNTCTDTLKSQDKDKKICPICRQKINIFLDVSSALS
jgi:hypothetical protein